MIGNTVIYRHARLATMSASSAGLGIVDDGAVVVRGGRIAYAGRVSDLPSSAFGSDATVVDCEGRLITPGLVDCHTHLVHGGERSSEFEMRVGGASYEEIAQAGGGINSTVSATRLASDDELFASALTRLDQMMAGGVTTIEIKSGYGLDLATEARLLRVARRLGRERDVTVRATFLGAHALPPEATGDKDAYIDLITETMLPGLSAERLVDAVDGFCEGIAFSPAQVGRVFERAAVLGLPVKLHADQLSDLGGAALAARYQALSADHLEYTSDAGAAAMASAGTVAVMLPGAFYFLRETQRPPIEAFRRYGTWMAVATDYNPGTSPLTSLLTAMNMAATLFRMTVDECLAGVTREASRALGLLNETGTLEPGKRADLAIWNVERPAELVCRLGDAPLHMRIHGGVSTERSIEPTLRDQKARPDLGDR